MGGCVLKQRTDAISGMKAPVLLCTGTAVKTGPTLRWLLKTAIVAPSAKPNGTPPGLDAAILAAAFLACL